MTRSFSFQTKHLARSLLLLLLAAGAVTTAEEISAEPYGLQKFCEVGGYQMAYRESGEGDTTLVFLHGNPTSSYLWRNIVPKLDHRGRTIAPDLIGMGDSDKLNDSGVDSYTFVQHISFLDGLLECVGVTDNVILVIHDWGSALGFNWAYNNQDAVKGIVYFEAITQPWEFSYFPPYFEDFFTPLRTPGVGEEIVLQQNAFVESLKTGGLRNLTEEEMDHYRAPYMEPGESRRPTLTWPREVPFGGEPANVAALVATYSEWMATNDLPKLLIVGNPGTLMTPDPLNIPLMDARKWKNQTEASVAGVHFLQEDSPKEIAEAINTWMDDVFVEGTATTSGAAITVWALPASTVSITLFLFGLKIF